MAPPAPPPPNERTKSTSLPAYLDYARMPRTPNPMSQRSPDSTIKRLIVLCDGTWKASDAGPPNIPTNITRFCRALDCTEIKDDMEIQQVVYYQNGLGTGSMAIGIDDNVRAAYAFLANNYQHGMGSLPDDEIYLFGFSRGAYTARSLAGFISKVGLLTKRGMDEFNLIYEEYKRGPENFNEFAKKRIEESKNGIPWEAQVGITIKVIGCFDTVGSVGLPTNAVVNWLGLNEKFGYYQAELADGVENAFHALALDEKRTPFTPSLWHIPHNKNPDDQPHPLLRLSHTNSLPGMPAPSKRVNLVQCWFPGVHSNVGGGYSDQRIADMTLAWMIDRCQPFLKFDWSYISPICLNTERPTVIKTSADYHTEIKKPTVPDKIAVKGGKGWGQGTVYDSSVGFFEWWSKTRTPGRYRRDGITNEYIHPSVRVRFQSDPEYARQCTALKDMKCIYDDKTGKWMWKYKNLDGKDVYMEEMEFGKIDWSQMVERGVNTTDMHNYNSMEELLAGDEGSDIVYNRNGSVHHA